MDDYRCDKCGKTTVDRKTMIWRAPRILALAFKRTVFSRGFPFKDERTVSFQPTLDLSEYFMRPLGVMKYNLVGTGDHVGVANSGHCFSYVATLEGWKLFDDMRVSDITEPICPSSNQYMLFYTKTVN
jgi:ubiquitin C-terminal hydrolase